AATGRRAAGCRRAPMVGPAQVVKRQPSERDGAVGPAPRSASARLALTFGMHFAHSPARSQRLNKNRAVRLMLASQQGDRGGCRDREPFGSHGSAWGEPEARGADAFRGLVPKHWRRSNLSHDYGKTTVG